MNRNIFAEYQILVHWTLLFSFVSSQESWNNIFCPGDYLELACAHNEIIILEEARYGRMMRNRCVSNTNNLGCSGVAMPIVAPWCTGKSSCKQQIYDDDFREIMNCPAGSTGYLETKHTCKAVDAVSRPECLISLSDRNSGILSLGDITNTCGSETSPIIIEVKIGQTLNMSLLDYSPRQSSQSTECVRNNYGILSDMSSRKSEELCPTSNAYQQVMHSNSNKVQVTLKKYNIRGTVLLQYYVVGCADVTGIRGARMHRNGNTLHFECTTTGATATLHCRAGKWLQEAPKCTSDGDSSESKKKTNFLPEDISQDEVIKTAGILALILSGVLVCTGILYFCVKMCQQTKQKPSANTYLTYRAQDQRVLMHTLPRQTLQRRTLPHHPQATMHPQASVQYRQAVARMDVDPLAQRTWSRMEVPDVIDHTLHSMTSQQSREEGIYENPGHPHNDNGSGYYSSVMNDDWRDERALERAQEWQDEPEYSNSIQYRDT